jgi:serine protease Do
MRPRLSRHAILSLLIVLLVLTGHAPSTANTSRRTPIVEAVERLRPSVVNISAEESVVVRTDPFFDDFFQRFFEPRRRRVKRTNLGSGVIIRPEGFVVTNAHVVARGQRISVTLADEREFEATLVGADPHADLAVLRIEGSDLPAAKFGPSHDLMIGESVIAIGNPFGFSHTVTTGVISATERSLRLEARTYYDFIQTDASINPGNSGGPLLNIDGDLIGINTAIWGRAENIGFAIPAERAERIVDELITYGHVRPAWLGIHVQDLTPALAQALETNASRGVVVREVDEQSPAALAGIVIGDVILSLDDNPVRERAEFDDRVAGAGVGAHLALELARGSEQQVIRVKAAALTEPQVDQRGWKRLGLRVGPASKPGAVVITSVRRKSPIARAGVEAGDLLLAVAERPVPTVAEFRRIIGTIRGPAPIAVVVRRGNRSYQLTLPGDG